MLLTYNELPEAMAYLIKLVEDLNDRVKSGAQPDKHPSKMLDFNEALKLLKDAGFSMSKSKLYKLTSKHIIPCKYFGNRLMFDAKELLNWCNSQLKSKDDLKGEATLAIVNDAQRKMYND